MRGCNWKVGRVVLLVLLFGMGCGTRQIRRNGVLIPYDEAAVLELQDLKLQHKDVTETAYIADLNRFIQAYEDAPAVHEARFLMAQALYKRNRLEESYRILNDIDLQAFAERERQKVLYLLAMNARENGMYLEAAQWTIELLKVVISSEMRSALKKELSEIIVKHLSKEDLEILASAAGEKYPDLYYQWGELLYQGGETEKALVQYEKGLELTTDSSEQEKIRNRIAEIKKVYETNRQVIGAILPLSGDYEALGERSLKGIEQALSFYHQESPLRYELAIYDSQGDPQKASLGVEHLLEAYGTIAIVGPLLSNTSEPAALRAQQLKIPLINLSQHDTITEIGDYIFQVSMTREHQADALVRFACGDKGFRHFAILYPEDSYGIGFANRLWDKIESCGGTVEGIEAYASGQASFNDEVKKLGGIHQPRARKDAYRLHEEQAKIELNREEVPESLVKIPPQIDFEAVFIPDYAKTVGQIAPTFAYYDIEHLMLLGTQAWHSPKLVERGQEHVEGAVFVDGFFRSTPNPQVHDFVQSFQKSFGDYPEIWEAQAFDATKLLLSQLEDPEIQTRDLLKERLNSLSSFEGVTGSIRFLDHHRIQKDLFLLTVRQGQIQSYKGASSGD